MLLEPLSGFNGRLCLPGDKSLSHRLVLISLLLHGRLHLANLSDCEDINTSIRAVEQLGVKILRTHDGIELTGPGKIPDIATSSPTTVDCGNSGTTARLICGILASRNGSYRLSGDASLSSRPMARVIAPLAEMGANICSENGRTLPITISKSSGLRAIRFQNRYNSAQVKSAILLAALSAEGITSVIEPFPSRNHTEILLRSLGVPIHFSEGQTELAGPADLQGNYRFDIPGDISSAAFLAVTAAIFPGSCIEIENVLLNSGRTGFLDILKRMGADIEITTTPDNNWETRGRLTVKGQRLRGIHIAAAEVPGLIDELPALAVAMAFAGSESSVVGAGELRNKESDRIRVLTTNLKKAGVVCDEMPDGFRIAGNSSISERVELDPAGDHRLAMAFTILAAHSQKGLKLKNPDCVKISFPTFFDIYKHCARK